MGTAPATDGSPTDAALGARDGEGPTRSPLDSGLSPDVEGALSDASFDATSDPGPQRADGRVAPDTGAPDTGAHTPDGGSDSGSTTSPAGVEAYCMRYFECGGAYYEDVDSCVAATTDFWGMCPARRTVLDAFADCMVTMPCEDYDPDAYDPAATPCGEQWQDVLNSSC